MSAVVRRADPVKDVEHINRLLPGATDCVLLHIDEIGMCAAAGYKPIGNSAVLVVNVPDDIDWMWKYELPHYASILPCSEYEAVYARESDIKIKWHFVPAGFKRIPFQDIPDDVKAELGEVAIWSRVRSHWSNAG